jgi:hypothetical protein
MLPVIVGALAGPILSQLLQPKQEAEAMREEYIGDDDIESLIAGEGDETTEGEDDEIGKRIAKAVRRVVKPRTAFIPFSSASIAAAATVSTEVKAVGGEWWRVIGLVVDNDIAADGFLADLKIGNKSIFLADGELALTMFRSDAHNRPPIRSDIIKAGGIVVVKVRNAHASAAMVANGALICEIIKPGS